MNNALTDSASNLSPLSVRKFSPSQNIKFYHSPSRSFLNFIVKVEIIFELKKKKKKKKDSRQ